MFLVRKMNDEQIEAKVREIIDELRPFLVSDGGTLDFVSYKDGIVYVSLGGACADCVAFGSNGQGRCRVFRLLIARVLR